MVFHDDCGTDPAALVTVMWLAFAEKMCTFRPAVPLRKPDVEAEVVKVVPAKKTDKDVIATVFLQGREAGEKAEAGLIFP